MHLLDWIMALCSLKNRRLPKLTGWNLHLEMHTCGFMALPRPCTGPWNSSCMSHGLLVVHGRVCAVRFIANEVGAQSTTVNHKLAVVKNMNCLRAPC